jgi:[acyl-carrier-protein] S-malonyltransferase
MAQALAQTPPGAFTVPLFANVTAAPVTDPAEVQRLLVEQVTGRVRWRESVIAMQTAGVEQFVELGGKVLGPMIGRCVADVKMSSIVTMDDIEALVKEI